MVTVPKITLVSSCLVGLCTRYDGRLKTNPACLKRLESVTWIPVCPEQLGGLSTPREAADIHNGDGHDVLSGDAVVLTKSGLDITQQFIKGAHQVLDIAQRQNVHTIILKSGSPSCAVKRKVGVTAALLQQHGFKPEEMG